RPEDRWAPLARQIDRDLTRGPSWSMLADHIDLADRHGLHVLTLLPALVASHPLDHDNPASDLAYRLLANTDFPIDSAPARRPRQPQRPATNTHPTVSPTRRPDATPGR
ncbi:MAG: hypothetical protein M3Y71_08185, partial [Actinomycetota bacterium]|nr:hypothetical protein [Actinomycetota bacterium]